MLGCRDDFRAGWFWEMCRPERTSLLAVTVRFSRSAVALFWTYWVGWVPGRGA